MTASTRTLNFVPGKVRTIDEPPPGLDPRQAWLAIRPYPPGIEPAFIGSVWAYYDGRPDPRTPVVLLQPHDAADPRDLQLSVFANPGLGGSAFLDPAPGWRRIDFLFQIPASEGVSRATAYVLAGPDAGEPNGRVPQGHLARGETWHFAREGSNPFAVAERAELRPGFVGGAPKSGTTWMQLLLNQHPMIYASGEGSLAGNVTMRPWVRANQWYPLHMTSAALHHFANQAVLARTLNMFRDHTGCAVVVDKSPGNAMIYRLLLTYMPSARLIHCVRHPLDVLISRLHHEATLAEGGRVSPDIAGHQETTMRLPALLAVNGPVRLDESLWPLLEQLLEHYAQFQTHALSVQDAGPGKLLLVRYEDMLAQPEAEAARVYAHLGVPAGPDLVARCVQNVSFASLKEHRRGARSSFFRSGTAGQYEYRLTPTWRTRIMKHLRTIMPRYDELGYA